MELKMFAVYDSKALRYGVPMFVPTVGAAVRSFQDVANDHESVICRHASDFVLYEVGTYDDETGVVVVQSPFKNLGNASEFKRVAKPPIVYNPAGLDAPADGKKEK